jgi:hypothetical protein
MRRLNGTVGSRPGHVLGAGRFGTPWPRLARDRRGYYPRDAHPRPSGRSRPTRIVAFNTTEGWSRDVTLDIADELRRRFAEYDDVPVSVLELLEMAKR